MDAIEENKVQNNENSLIKDESGVKDKKSKIRLRAILEILLYLIFAICFLKYVPEYVFERVSVEGSSMCETLHDNDQLIGGKISVNLHRIKRYDIVYFYPKGNRNVEAYIKRVIGLPGETVQIIDSVIYIDGSPIEDPFIAEKQFESYLASEPITLDEDEYFVMGDNRNHSTDSRRASVGPVSYNDIEGKAVFRIWPLKNFGTLK